MLRLICRTSSFSFVRLSIVLSIAITSGDYFVRNALTSHCCEQGCLPAAACRSYLNACRKSQSLLARKDRRGSPHHPLTSCKTLHTQSYHRLGRDRMANYQTMIKCKFGRSCAICGCVHGRIQILTSQHACIHITSIRIVSHMHANCIQTQSVRTINCAVP